MKILSVGTMRRASNTCKLRTDSLKKIADEVDIVETEAVDISLWYKVAHHLFLMGLPIMLPDNSKANKNIIQMVKEKKYDIVWIDKGLTIRPSTLKKIKRICPETRIVSYSPDNMVLRHNQSQNYLGCFPLYDLHVTTKSFITDKMIQMGARRVRFVDKTYDNEFHYPREITPEDRIRLGADVGFVGAWEQERMDSILFLSRNGIKVRVFGNSDWKRCLGDNPNLTIENHGLYDEDYAKSFRCFKISLCFLRKMNHDQQTSRTMEIPACGGFMLAERTPEHLRLFREGKEAEFFGSNEELLEKCQYYLAHEEERMKIIEGSQRRCHESGYSNVETLKKVINEVLETKGM